ncbi:MAG TPA: alpha/beta fold hydrolase [Pyrinomonadaceae bacterium]|nr:alpha/beta fold hydrolase [Pyrinomonadaceae bacterium]
MSTDTLRDGGRLADSETGAAADHIPPQALSTRLGEVARAFRAKPFVPHPLLRNPHAQTVAASTQPGRRRSFREEGALYESRLFEVEEGTRVLLRCRWQEERKSAPTLLLLHGLEGSTESLYMLGTAQKAFRRGFNVVGMNMRNCGGTEHLAATLYHSGLTRDFARVLEEELAGREGLSEIFVAGFSMSGNMVLRLAGEYGAGAPKELAGVAAVSPSIDLHSCADALESRANTLYRLSFVRNLRDRVRRKSRLRPGLYDTSALRRVRTIRQFDERYTAPHGGFHSASDYYDRTSSRAFIPAIRVPALIIHALDDPLIPAEPFRDPGIASNPEVLLVLTRGGGHVGFISAPARGEDRHWAENRVVEFCRLLSRAEGRG